MILTEADETWQFAKKFELFSRRAGINATINLPKFLLPVSQSNFVDVNTPRTIFATGVNLLDRVNLFTLINTSASINYRWNETNEKQWNISPAFINYINLPYISDSFQKQLNDYPILEKTYSNTFIGYILFRCEYIISTWWIRSCDYWQGRMESHTRQHWL